MKLLDCFPKWLHNFTFPQTLDEGSDFSTISTTLLTACIFTKLHLGGCKAFSISLWFWFVVPRWLMMSSIFSCAQWLFVYFGDMSIQSDPLHSFCLGYLYFYSSHKSSWYFQTEGIPWIFRKQWHKNPANNPIILQMIPSDL